MTCSRSASYLHFPNIFHSLRLFRRYYLDANSLTIIGKPSASLADKLEKETNDLVSHRVSELGEAGLKKLQDNIEAAQKTNDVEVPQEILSGFKIPDVDGIRWIDVKSAGAGKNKREFGNEVQSRLEKDDVDLPYFIQFEREWLSLLCLPS